MILYSFDFFLKEIIGTKLLSFSEVPVTPKDLFLLYRTDNSPLALNTSHPILLSRTQNFGKHDLM